jgi:hypothetical protein
MNADGNALPGCGIERHIRSTCSTCGAAGRVREALTVWTALTLYHNAGHQHMGSHRRVSAKAFHLRTSAIKLRFIRPSGTVVPHRRSQFASFKSGTRSNSLVLSVTRTASRNSACVAIRRSMAPIGVPFSLRCARTRP